MIYYRRYWVLLTTALMLECRRNARKIQEFQDSLAAGMAPDADQADDGGEQGDQWGAGKEHPEDYRNWEREFGDKLLEAPDFVIKFEELRTVKQIGHGGSCWLLRVCTEGGFRVYVCSACGMVDG